MDSFGKKKESKFFSNSNERNNSLVLHNDNINSFDYVIESLCEICNHETIQAEQCAFITHFTGKCQIKRGSFDELSPMRERLSCRQLHVTID